MTARLVSGRGIQMSAQLQVFGTVAIGLLLAVVAPPAWAQHGATDGQWTAYGGDNGATNYSSLDQITGVNVNDLQIVWEREAVDQSILDLAPDLRPGLFGFFSTPLMIDGLLYAANGVGLVEAFNPGTAETGVGARAVGRGTGRLSGRRDPWRRVLDRRKRPAHPRAARPVAHCAECRDGSAVSRFRRRRTGEPDHRSGRGRTVSLDWRPHSGARRRRCGPVDGRHVRDQGRRPRRCSRVRCSHGGPTVGFLHRPARRRLLAVQRSRAQ